MDAVAGEKKQRNHHCCLTRFVIRSLFTTLNCNSLVLGLGFYGLAWDWLDDFDFGIARVDLLFEPGARCAFSMGEQDRAWLNLTDEVQQLVPVRMRGQVKILNFAK